MATAQRNITVNFPPSASTWRLPLPSSPRTPSEGPCYDIARRRPPAPCTGAAPAQYPQYAALRGDPSDNLPGVPGVGEKTAAKLITTYGDLDGVFSNLDACTPKLR